jgi:hypothetical protein
MRRSSTSRRYHFERSDPWHGDSLGKPILINLSSVNPGHGEAGLVLALPPCGPVGHHTHLDYIGTV